MNERIPNLSIPDKLLVSDNRLFAIVSRTSRHPGSSSWKVLEVCFVFNTRIHNNNLQISDIVSEFYSIRYLVITFYKCQNLTILSQQLVLASVKAKFLFSFLENIVLASIKAKFFFMFLETICREIDSHLCFREVQHMMQNAVKTICNLRILHTEAANLPWQLRSYFFKYTLQ